MDKQARCTSPPPRTCSWTVLRARSLVMSSGSDAIAVSTFITVAYRASTYTSGVEGGVDVCVVLSHILMDCRVVLGR